MSNGFEKREIAPEDGESQNENPKEVVNMDDVFTRAVATLIRRESKDGMSRPDAIKTVAAELGFDEVAFAEWLASAPQRLEKEATSRQKVLRKQGRKYHTVQEAQQYRDSRPDLFE